MRTRIGALVAAAALLAFAWVAPGVRHRLIAAITTWDAPPAEPVRLPPGDGPGMTAVAHVRVILIDGLSADVAATLPTWSELCKRGLALQVDVGFPTISLPVEVALWTGLTQQQTGVMFRSDRPLVPPLDRRGIPAQIAGSRAVAENHGWIVRSLGFSDVQPAALDDKHPATDANAEAWKTEWEAAAKAAVASDAPLVFVHVLRVDTAGHKFGRDSADYRVIAGESDAILASLVPAAPGARWFLLSDHGHLAGGGHGGEEPSVRQVQHCIVGPGIAPSRGGLVHVVDVARALADSVGAKLDREARGRPLSVALASPLADDQAIPPVGLGRGVIAIFILVIGAGGATWGLRRWWLAPWWFVVACASLVLLRGMPTLSTPMVYAPEGRVMYVTWLPALALAAVSTWIGMSRTTLPRVVVSQLALPLAAVAAALTVTGAWPVLTGTHVAPVVPRYTAWLSPLLLIAAHGSAAVALAVLGRTARSAFGPRSPPETPSSAPAAG